MVNDIQALKRYHNDRIEFWINGSNDTLKQEAKDSILTFHREQLERVNELCKRLLDYAKS